MISSMINQKRVNDIFLATIALDSFELSTSHIAALDSIAWQCPWSGGDAVFQARGMLSIVRDTVYNDSLLCAQQQQYKLAGEGSPAGKLKIYPNPADEVMTIEIGEIENATLRIFNGVGRIHYETKITAAQQTLDIQTGKWVPGMYYCV